MSDITYFRAFDDEASARRKGIYITIEPTIPKGFFRPYVPGKYLCGYFIYRVNGQYYEFFTKTPLIEIRNAFSNASTQYIFENTDIIIETEHTSGSYLVEGLHEVRASEFLQKAEPFMQDNKAKLAMEKHLCQAKARDAAKKTEQAKKAADNRAAEDNAQRTLETWLKM